MGAHLALLLHWPVSQEIVLPVFFFIRALGVTFLDLRLARVSGGLDRSTLLLAGVGVSAVLTSLRPFFMMVLFSVSLQVAMSWLMGDVQAPGWPWMRVFLSLAAA